MANETKVQSGIYAIKNGINGKVYVGSAVNIRTRRNAHLFELRNNKHHSRYLQNAYNKYSEANFEFIIMEYVSDKEKLVEREQFYIDLLKSSNNSHGYNMCANASNCLGYKQTDETKRKKSLSTKGRPSPCRGRIMPEEQREKLKLSNTGKKRSELSKMRYSESKTGDKNPNYGKPLSEEIKYKLSINSRFAKRVICIETGQIYRSVNVASKECKVPCSNVSAVCKGKRNRVHGLTFRYCDEAGEVANL